jgi:ascorbate-specific PTS system EIIC-type component UlaA
MAAEPKKDPYEFDMVDAAMIAGATTSVALGLPRESIPKSFSGRLGTTIGFVFAAISGTLLVKWAADKFSSSSLKNVQPTAEIDTHLNNKSDAKNELAVTEDNQEQPRVSMKRWTEKQNTEKAATASEGHTM